MTFSILIFSRWQCYENSVTLGVVKCDQCQNTLDLLLLVWYFLKSEFWDICGYMTTCRKWRTTRVVNFKKTLDTTGDKIESTIYHKKLFIKENQIKNLASIIICTAVRTWPNYWSFGYQWCRYCLSYLRRPESDFSSYATIRIKINIFLINTWQ